MLRTVTGSSHPQESAASSNIELFGAWKDLHMKHSMDIDTACDFSILNVRYLGVCDAPASPLALQAALID